MELQRAFEPEREKLSKLLDERGMSNSDEVVRTISNEDLPGAFATVAWWDDQPAGQVGTGLFLHVLAKRRHFSYKRPHERTRIGHIEVGGISEKRRRSMRGVMLSPNGMTREEAMDMYEPSARKLDTTAHALIDDVMGASWQETPTHPALRHEAPASSRRYELWMGGHCNSPKIEAELARLDTESDFNWACRFWGWSDPVRASSKPPSRGQSTAATP